jgi:2,4-dienoyl-CoA reductase-like NADH-dependent reductase (Old Yellow Enzyme family)
MTSLLNRPLKLPCGAVLPNRLAKAAMTEGLADAHNRVTDAHYTLYRRWASNGLGLMVTGNVQCDRRQLERPGNIAIDGNGGLEALKALAKIGTADGAHFWMQINHPGRQTSVAINPNPLAPSAISVAPEIGCGMASAMTREQVQDVVRRFVHVSSVARDTGFTGVQIHAAHGYLLSNFLSPDANCRTDEYGGSLENRARLLLEIVGRVRDAVGAEFPIAVKLNSADFQKGGFSEDDSVRVVKWLSDAGIDLLEVSGGNYEQMSMVGRGGTDGEGRLKAASTVAREAYFLDYARRVRPLAKMPLMITGGMRRLETIQQALSEGACEVIGLGRPMCSDPDSSARALLDGSRSEIGAADGALSMPRDALGPDVPDNAFRTAESFGILGWYCTQILRLGQGLEPDHQLTALDALMAYKASEEAALSRWDRPAKS